MSHEIVELIEHVTDLQEVVEAMILHERRDELGLQYFLNTLSDDDFEYLIGLDYDRKAMYLQRRFLIYRSMRSR